MQGIRHTGIYVNDLESMILFYKDIFDVSVAVRQKEQGTYTDTIFNENSVGVEVCKLTFADRGMIELVHYARGDNSPDWDEKIHRCGKMHIAVTVDSAWDMYRKLEEKGCLTLSEPCDAPDGKARVFFARDPEGNYLELVEEL